MLIGPFTISETDLEKIKETLENYGVALSSSDGSFELGEDEN